ncbi:hypothetical protein [Vulgatibacter incomptus]|uniref:Uncharacterized protein n=1 Tax=Vulgatibacter incomptus TaxID=1391653 RepID=A0A0K1PI43_9BACT|nr:hypothetical protein [Vulgatibacter incomptus]AKU92769.1 hypothetical protein AKJ08_3156 [Vulgatibacter incomptus]
MHASRGRWRLGRWLWPLNEKLLAVARGEIKRFFVVVPPRHDKSESISKYFPRLVHGDVPRPERHPRHLRGDVRGGLAQEGRDVLEEHGPSVFGVEVTSVGKATAGR